MATVSLLNVSVRNNPAKFDDKYEFEITFECLEPLVKDLEWKLTYVGSATSSDHDQELDTLLVGPIPVGVNKFLFEADPPNTARIPATDIIGVTVILLSCSYDDREFVRVGYYVNNEYDDPALVEEPPAKPVIEKVRRNILAEKPRVTRFAIKWDSEESAPAEFPPEQPDVDEEVEDGVQYGAEEEEEGEGEGEEVKGEDVEMEGVEGVEGKVKVEEDEESDAGSEDLGEDSEEDEDEELEEEDGEGEGEANGDDMETDEKDTSGTDHDPDEHGGDRGGSSQLTASALAAHNTSLAEFHARQAAREEAREAALAHHNVHGNGAEAGPILEGDTPSDRGSESHCDSPLLDCETDVPPHIDAMLDEHNRLPGIDYTFK